MSKYMVYIIIALQITMVVLSKAHVCGSSSVGIMGSNPAEGMDVRILCFLRIKQVTVSKTSRSFLRSSPIAYHHNHHHISVMELTTC